MRNPRGDVLSWPAVAGEAPVSYREKLRELLLRKSLVRGRVVLSSGKTSDYYLDCKLTTLDPEGALLTGQAILELLAERGIAAEAIGGLSMGADPVVSAVVIASQLAGRPLPGFLVRKERKPHGRQKRIEGFEGRPGARVVVVDEVCTTGQSTLEAIAAVEEQRWQVAAVVSLVDRQEGGSAALAAVYNYLAVFTATDLLR